MHCSSVQRTAQPQIRSRALHCDIIMAVMSPAHKNSSGSSHLSCWTTGVTYGWSSAEPECCWVLCHCAVCPTVKCLRPHKGNATDPLRERCLPPRAETEVDPGSSQPSPVTLGLSGLILLIYKMKNAGKIIFRSLL